MASLVVAGMFCTHVDAAAKRSVEIPFVSKGPVLKGNMSDPVWKTGALLDRFTSLSKVNVPIQPTTVRALYDSKYLYLGVSCQEPNMATLVAHSRGRDNTVWKDDDIEVLIDTANTQNMFYHFFVNPLGGYFATKCMGIKSSGSEWRGSFKVKTSQSASGWMVELAVPFSEMGITPTQGLVWGMNVCRNRMPGERELSAWNPSPWGFEKPDRFGQVIFGDKSGNCRGIRLLTWGDMGVDELAGSINKVSCSIPNNTRKSVSYKAILRKVSNGKVVKTIEENLRVKPGKTALLDIPYKIAGSDGGQWRLDINSNGSSVFKAENDVAAISAPERVWKVKDPLYKELLSSNPPGDQRYGSIYWLHTYSQNELANFGKEYGIRYSNDEAIKELRDAKLLALCGTSQFKDEYFVRMLDKYKVKVLFVPDLTHWSAPDAPKSWNASFLLDPRSRAQYFNDLNDGLSKWHKYIWGVYSGDEVDNYVMHQAVELYAEHRDDYPFIRDVNEQVKNKYGDGKYGIPESLRDTNPYRWIALRRWVMVYLNEWQKDVYSTVKREDPEIRVISMDPPGDHRPVSFDRAAPYFDIATHQLYPPTDPNRQQFGFITKLVSDLTGKPTWPCTHVEHYAFSTTLDEVRELMSQVTRNGGKSFHFWLKDQVGNLSDSGFLMATKWSFPDRWRLLKDINTLNATMNEVAIPTDPDIAVFYSEDHYSAFGEIQGRPNEPEWAYTFFGPVARTWFKFVNDNMVEDGTTDLSMFKVVVIPAAKYERRIAAEALLKYVTDGGTLVIGDPAAFTTDVNGEPLTDVRATLIGKQALAASDQDTIKFDSDCSMPNLRNRTLSNAGKVCKLDIGEQTEVMARFSDGSPAVIRNIVGKGSVIVFAANPFTQGGISDEGWKDFFKAFSKDLGLKTDREIWRFEFPEFKNAVQPEPAGSCLTGNYIKWWQDGPVYTHNARSAGTYTYSLQPDGVADRGEGNISFASGKLTDRKSAYTTPKSTLKPEDFVVTWMASKPVDVAFDLKSTQLVDRVNLWYSGQLPDVKVLGSIDGKSWKELARYPGQEYVKPDGVVAREDVMDISMKVVGDPKTRYVKLSFGRRDAGNPLTLAECEIWGGASK
ncbi:MAG TPA: sugar-binding protein [Armatimonadota bacterium]